MGRQARIERDPGTLQGEPHIRGTDIPVSAVVSAVAALADVRQVLSSYPALSEEDVRECISYAAECSHARESRATAEANTVAGGGHPKKAAGLKEYLLSMPNVGDDADFERPLDYGRPDVEWDT